jgi:hypothetical protein
LTSLAEQLLDPVFAWDHEFGLVELSVIELAFDPHELRVPRGMPHAGEWVHAPLAGDVPGEGIHRYVIPAHSRLVTTRGKYKDPADHPFWKAHPVSPENVIAAYDKTDPGQREQGAAWYREIHNMAGTYIAPGKPEEGAILLSNYSPQTYWPINMMNAARSARRGYGIGPGEGVMASTTQANKANKAIAGEGIDKLMTTAKTHSFGALISRGDDSPDDPYGHVVIDTHAVNIAAGGDIRGKKGGYGDAPIGDARQHEYVADQYRIAARRISERDGKLLKPHELQAITWVAQVKANEAVDAWQAQHAPAKEAGVFRGRIASHRKDWTTWLAYAKKHKIPLIPGVSAPPPALETVAGQLLAIQVLEMVTDGSLTYQLLDLALQPWIDEPRDKKGEWATKLGDLAPGRRKSGRVRKWITAAEARGNSRPVSMDEYQHLAALGNAWIDRAKRDHAPITGLDLQWDRVKSDSWREAQKPWGGATIDAHTGVALQSDADRYALSVKPRGMEQVRVPETASQAEFSAAMDQAKERFRPVLERKSFYLGVFHDDENNRIDIDPVAVVDTADLVEQVGAYTRAIGGAYHFKSGDGYWPPHVAEGSDMAGDEGTVHFDGPGQWLSQAADIQDPEPGDEPDGDSE